MDMEARGHSEHPEALRLWLRLLTCTQLIEKEVRTQLRSQFNTTLPRFDLMTQLKRSPEGEKMNELSRRMMVTGGNVTGITDQLVGEGLVERVDVEGDRRAYCVRLMARRRSAFGEMARGMKAGPLPRLKRFRGAKSRRCTGFSARSSITTTRQPGPHHSTLWRPRETLHWHRQPDASPVRCDGELRCTVFRLQL